MPKERAKKGLGEPSKAQLDDEREVRTVILTSAAKSGLYGKAILDDHRSLKDVHIELLERADVSLASERMCNSFFHMFSVCLTKEEAKHVAGLDEVEEVLLPFYGRFC